jgi:anti-sigma factor RsiW
MQFRRLRRRTIWQIAAAAVLSLGLGGTGGWMLHRALVHSPSSMTVLMREAVANHVVYTADRRRPTELGADQRDDLAHWVSNRLNHPVAPPDLSSAGYHYIGGRLAATAEGPAGMFMYQDDHAQRLTVFVRPVSNGPNMPMEAVENGKLDGCAWIEKGVGYTVVAAVPPEVLRHIADQVQQQLETAL